MGQPSTQASNAIIYLSYGAFLYVASQSVLNSNEHRGGSLPGRQIEVSGLLIV